MMRGRGVTQAMLGLVFLVPSLAILSAVAMTCILVVLGVVGLMVSIIHLKNKQPCLVIPMPVIWSWLFCGLLLIWMLVSCTWTITPAASLSKWFSVLGLCFAGLMLHSTFAFLPNQTCCRIIEAIFYGMILSCILYLVELYCGGPIKTYFQIYWFSKKDFYFNLYEMNIGATLSALIAWPVIAYYLSSKRYHVVVCMWVIVVAVLSQLESLAATVSFLISTVAFIGLYTIQYLTKTYDKVLGVLFCLVCLLSIYIPLMFPELFFYKMSLSAQHRVYIWKFVLSSAFIEPLTGWGFDSARAFSRVTSHYNIPQLGHPLPLHPHNGFLQIFFELGLVGIGLFLGIVGGVFKGISICLSTSLYRNAAIAQCMVYLSVMSVSYGVWQSWWIASAFLMSMCMAISYKGSLAGSVSTR